MTDRHWSAAAATEAGAREAVWNDTGQRWEHGVHDCLTAVLARLGDFASIVDYGCGVGRLTIPLAYAVPDVAVLGYDPTPAMLAWARKADEYEQVTWLDDLPLPMVDAAFTVVTLQHLDAGHVIEAFAAVAAALTPGGRFVAQFVEGDHHQGLDHRYTVEAITELASRAGLAVVATDRGAVFPEWVWLTMETTT